MTVSARPRHPVTGRRFRLSARTERELGAYMHRIDTLRTELRLGVRTADEVDRQLRHLRHGPVTLERAARAYLDRPALARNTKRRVRSLVDGDPAYLAPLLPLPVAALDVPTLSAWIRSLERRGTLHPTTIGTIWRGLSAIVRHAGERGWVGAVPWGKWRPRLSTTPKHILEAARTLDELARLLAAARACDDEDRSYLSIAPADTEPKIACASLLGLRQGELAGLRWHEIAWGPPIRVRVVRQWVKSPLKMNAPPIEIESIDELAEILTRYRAHLEACHMYDPRGPVFPARTSVIGKPRPYASGEVLTRLNLRAAVERAQLPQIGSWSAHGLRATFVTLEAAASGGDLRRVASRSRHATIAGLARYLRALSRSRDPAPPAFSFLPGSSGAGGAGVPLLGQHRHPRRETPP
jgi:integrase